MSVSPLVRELLVNGLMASTAVHKAKKTSTAVAYYAAAGAVALVAFVFLAIAGYGALLQSYSMPIAAGITGIAVLAIACAIGLTGYMSLNKKQIKKPSLDGNFLDSIEHTAKTLLAGFEEPIKDNPKLALMLAALAGFAAADQISEKIH